MKSLRITYLICLLLGFSSVGMAQVDTTAVDSVALDSTVIDTLFLFSPEYTFPADTVALSTTATDTLFLFPPTFSAANDTIEIGEEKEQLVEIQPWDFRAPTGAKKAATDSTLRWQNWPDWTYKLNREPGIISYRLGTSYRSNAVQRNAHEPRYQQLYWEDISLNDPVSGTVNWGIIPQSKVSAFYERDVGTIHRSRYFNHQYYINKPLSRLIYSESKFNHRNLEFEVSHNLSQRTNIELSYWDRRTGGEYDNSQTTGRQIYAKASHHLGNNQYLKLNYVTNSDDVSLPFGYNIPNHFAYNFDRYTTSPNQPSAVSEKSTSILALNYYQRKADSTETNDHFRVGLFRKANERLIDVTNDTTGYSLSSYGANIRKWWQWGGLELEGGANGQYFLNNTPTQRSFFADNWGTARVDGSLSIDVIPFLSLIGDAEFQIRSDGFQSYLLNGEGEMFIGDFLLSAGLSSGSVMPTPQQLYWDSQNLNGNPDLQNEKVQEVRGELKYHITPDTKIGVRGQHKDITDGIMMSDSLFANVDSYASQSATAFFEWNLTHFEFEGSTIFHRFADSYLSPTGTIPMQPQERLWLKGSAYWKGYLFDRATYVKAGVSGMASPFRYQADHYNPTLNFWQPLSADQQLPMYNRLDVDISARVRSIMFILRWENVLDDVSQLGYFETAQYPMSQRRFIFSVRALFRN
ncbi:putative porin [Fodinibius sp. Rm-B-1B1-1]|uniref:putative porin n=1 Tax=Fodinibius alkaliphilus TaxID=3140241 RepID=UPI00315A3931